MSDCQTTADVAADLEAFVFGELDSIRAAEVEAHTARCAACAAEVAWLRAERAVFAARKERIDTAAPPAFAEVLARSRRSYAAPADRRPERASPWRRGAHVAQSLAAAAALAGLVISAARQSSSPRSPVAADPAEHELACRDESTPNLTARGAEEEAHACLVATPATPATPRSAPVSVPAPASARPEDARSSEHGGSCGLVTGLATPIDDSDVTCTDSKPYGEATQDFWDEGGKFQ